MAFSNSLPILRFASLIVKTGIVSTAERFLYIYRYPQKCQCTFSCLTWPRQQEKKSFGGWRLIYFQKGRTKSPFRKIKLTYRTLLVIGRIPENFTFFTYRPRPIVRKICHPQPCFSFKINLIKPIGNPPTDHFNKWC